MILVSGVSAVFVHVSSVSTHQKIDYFSHNLGSLALEDGWNLWSFLHTIMCHDLFL